MFESAQGGRDYGERPIFYAEYDGIKTYQKARSFSEFVNKHADRQAEVNKFLSQSTQDVRQLRYLPIIARQDWIAILSPKGEVVGYLQGDGF